MYFDMFDLGLELNIISNCSFGSDILDCCYLSGVIHFQLLYYWSCTYR
jgi:hypothetical protein